MTYKFLRKNGLSTKIKIWTIQAIWRSSKYFPWLHTISVHRSGSCSNPPLQNFYVRDPIQSARASSRSFSVLNYRPGTTSPGSGKHGSRTEKCRESRAGGKFDRSWAPLASTAWSSRAAAARCPSAAALFLHARDWLAPGPPSSQAARRKRLPWRCRHSQGSPNRRGPCSSRRVRASPSCRGRAS